MKKLQKRVSKNIEKLITYLEYTNKRILSIFAIFVFLFIWLVVQYFSQPSDSDLTDSYLCSTYYSNLYYQNRISMGFGISPMNNAELREQYFQSLIKEVQIAQAAAELKCGELLLKINYPSFAQPKIGNENFTGDELLVHQKVCRLGYEYLWYESFLNNEDYIRDEIDEELDCSAGQRIIEKLSN